MFTRLTRHSFLRARPIGLPRVPKVSLATCQLSPQEFKAIQSLPAPSNGTGPTGTEVAWEVVWELASVFSLLETEQHGRRVCGQQPWGSPSLQKHCRKQGASGGLQRSADS